MKSWTQFGALTMVGGGLAVMLPSLAEAQQRGYGGYGGWGHPMMWGGYGGWLGAIVMLVFWILVAVALVALVRWLWRSSERGSSQRGPAGGGEDRALQILRERFAKGELNQEQYQAMKKELSS